MAHVICRRQELVKKWPHEFCPTLSHRPVVKEGVVDVEDQQLFARPGLVQHLHLVRLNPLFDFVQVLLSKLDCQSLSCRLFEVVDHGWVLLQIFDVGDG